MPSSLAFLENCQNLPNNATLHYIYDTPSSQTLQGFLNAGIQKENVREMQGKKDTQK